MNKNEIFRIYSKIIGKTSKKHLPFPLNTVILKKYATHFGVKLNEAEKPLSQYHSIYDFFTRRLKEGARTFPQDEKSILSPSDGIIKKFGQINTGKMIQAKGLYYLLNDLIGNENTSLFNDGFFVTHYLRPGDYHRYHSPVEGQLIKMIYFPGEIFPVNPTAASKIKNLFARNERVFYLIKNKHGYVGMVIVGATAVGSIILNHWPDLVTNSGHGKILSKECEKDNILVRKGENIGFFGMGSTIISLLEKNITVLSLDLKEEKYVTAGTIIAHFI